MKKQQGFSFTFETYQTGTLIKIFVSMVLFCGLYACFWSALALSNTNVPPYLPATAGLFYCAAACKLPKRAGAFQVAAMVILLVYIGFAGRYIIDGWNVVMNSVFQLLERRLGYIFPRYELTQAVTPDFCAMLFLVLPAILLGMLSARAVCGARWWRAGIILLCLLLSAAILLSIYPPDWCCVLLALGLMFSCLQHTICFNTNPTRFRTVAAFSMLFLFLLAVCAVPALLWNESGIADAERNRLVWNRFVHQLRYEDHSTTLPEGDFKELQSFCPGDTTAITITMDSPRELYLRGFVGETYLGDGWTALESEQKAEYATLFSWLHERGFYGQTQFAQLCEALGESGGNSVSVQVEDTCTAWRYAAYEASDAGADPRQIGDADLPSSGLWGECAYTFSLGETPITQYQRVSDQLAAAHKAELPTAIAYLTSENAYRTYVYDNYLTVPADTQAAIAGVFAGLDLPKTGNVSFFDAQLIVRTYLSAIPTYTETPQIASDQSDLAVSFLCDTKEGYSVHYATAATLMFRYLGVPARYVEGWYLPEATAERMAPGEPLELDQSYAHAWVEIYCDGVGFVPFEITPPYTEPMEQSDTAQGGSGGAEIPPEEPENDPTQLSLNQIIWLLGLTVILLLLAAILVVLLRRICKRRKLKKMLEAQDARVAVSNITTWSVHLLGLLGIAYQNGSLSVLRQTVGQQFGNDLAAQYQQMLTAQQKALFSREPVDPADLEAARAVLSELELLLRRQGSWRRRLFLYWIECAF